jgi:hypothetical protein
VTREGVKNSDWGVVGAVSLNYAGEYASGSFGYSRDITLATGLNGVAVNDALTLSAQYQLSHELSSILTTGYTRLASDSSNLSAHAIKTQVFPFRVGLRYEFRPYTILKRSFIEASYGYSMIDDSTSSVTVNRHLVSVRFYVEHPFFE